VLALGQKSLSRQEANNLAIVSDQCPATRNFR